MLTIPASTADCERGFSVMKRIKSDWRSSLATPTLSGLMCGLLESSDIDTYDPSKACSLWAEYSRQPSYVRVKSSKRSSNVKSKELTPVVIDEDDSGEDDVEVDESDSSGESGSDSYSECESENDTE